MTKDEFVKTFLEGAEFSDKGKLIYALVEQLYDDRKTKDDMYTEIENIKERHRADIAEMDDIARDSGWHVRCRGCEKDFQPDCELSEIIGSERYCGGSEWCTP